MDTGAMEIINALQMVTAVAQKYLAKQAGTSQGVNNPSNNKRKEVKSNKRKHRDNHKKTGGKGKKKSNQNPLKKTYVGKFPKCKECNYHHTGACRECNNCQRKGHTADFCRIPVTQTNQAFHPYESHTCDKCGVKEGETFHPTPREGLGPTTVSVPTTIMAISPRGPYLGNLPMCSKCNYHHLGACRVLHCAKCDKVGHIARFCRTPTTVTITSTTRACYQCGDTGRTVRNCPKMINQNDGNTKKMWVFGTK